MPDAWHKSEQFLGGAEGVGDRRLVGHDPIGAGCALVDHEPAADRVVHLARELAAVGAERGEPHAVGMERQGLAAKEFQVLAIAERDLVAPEECKGSAPTNPRERGIDALGVDALGRFAHETEDHGLVGTVAPAGGAEGAVEMDLDGRGSVEKTRRVERGHEHAGSLHRSDGVGTGGPDADLEQVEDADSHAVTPSLHRCRRSPERPQGAKGLPLPRAVPRLTAFLRAC